MLRGALDCSVLCFELYTLCCKYRIIIEGILYLVFVPKFVVFLLFEAAESMCVNTDYTNRWATHQTKSTRETVS